MKRFSLTLGILMVTIGLPLTALGCGGGEEVKGLERIFTLDLRSSGTSGGANFEVNKDDRVTFNMRTNRTTRVRIADLNVEETAVPGKTIQLHVTVTEEGNFPVTNADTGEEIGILVVSPATGA